MHTCQKKTFQVRFGKSERLVPNRQKKKKNNIFIRKMYTERLSQAAVSERSLFNRKLYKN